MARINPIRQKVYKVLTPMQNSLFSATTSVMSLEYRKNKIIRPKIGKIFVFGDYEDAVAFHYLGHEIWEAEAYGCENAPSHIISASTLFENILKLFWEKNHRGTMNCPIGSLVCKSLKLIRKIQ